MVNILDSFNILDKNIKLFLRVLFITVIILTIMLTFFPLNPNIIQFELNANEVLNKWLEQETTRPSQQSTKWASLSLGLDFLYIPIYSTFLALGCFFAAKNFPEKNQLLSDIGIFLAWGQWLAAILDVIENIALIIILFTKTNNVLAFIAKWSAIPKFSLIILGLLYLVYVFLSRRK